MDDWWTNTFTPQWCLPPFFLFHRGFWYCDIRLKRYDERFKTEINNSPIQIYLVHSTWNIDLQRTTSTFGPQLSIPYQSGSSMDIERLIRRCFLPDSNRTGSARRRWIVSWPQDRTVTSLPQSSEVMGEQVRIPETRPVLMNCLLHLSCNAVSWRGVQPRRNYFRSISAASTGNGVNSGTLECSWLCTSLNIHVLLHPSSSVPYHFSPVHCYLRSSNKSL